MWIAGQKENPSLSKTELRRKLPDVYMRLYRNDHQWLERNSPRKRQVVYENRRVDWAKRDQQILIESQNAVQMLRQKMPPVRITIGSVGKILGLRSLLEKHLDKLPDTKTFLVSQTELVENFQIRRVCWAAYKISSSGEVVKEWQIMRLAGIKNTCSEELKQAINNIVLEANLPLHLFRKTAS